jgi:hypothetical protein
MASASASHAACDQRRLMAVLMPPLGMFWWKRDSFQPGDRSPRYNV